MNFYATYTTAEQQEEYTQAIAVLISSNPKLHAALDKFAKEFCYTFNTRIEAVKNGQVFVATPNGLPVGRLFKAGKGGRNNTSEPMFRFNGPFTVKRTRSLPGNRYDEKHVREGKTIAGLIRAIKKTDNPITEEYIAGCMTAGLGKGLIEAYYRYRHGGGGVAIDIPRRLHLAMTEFILGMDAYAIQQDKAALEKAHEKYMKDNAKKFAAIETAKRFSRGAIAVAFNNRNDWQHCFAAEIKGDPDKLDDAKLELVTPLTRYEAMPEVLGGKAIITKLYLQGKGETLGHNPFGVAGGTDDYNEDVDIAAVYNCPGKLTMQWVIVPKEDEGHVA